MVKARKLLNIRYDQAYHMELPRAIPYLNHLINEGSNVIIISEHWLWPFNLNQLQDINPNYTGFGFADKRLNEQSKLTRGCGGAGITRT